MRRVDDDDDDDYDSYDDGKRNDDSFADCNENEDGTKIKQKK